MSEWSDIVMTVLDEITPDPFRKEEMFALLRGRMGYTVALGQWRAGAQKEARELLKRELDELTS